MKTSFDGRKIRFMIEVLTDVVDPVWWGRLDGATGDLVRLCNDLERKPIFYAEAKHEENSKKAQNPASQPVCSSGSAQGGGSLGRSAEEIIEECQRNPWK